MQNTSYQICHPRQLQAKACSLVSSLLSGRCTAGDMGEYLYSLAVSNPKHTRTIALLVGFMLSELGWRDSTVCEALRRKVADTAVSRFISWWTREFSPGKQVDGTTHDDPENSAGIGGKLGETLAGVTAILGDLFAMNAIPVETMRSSVLYLFKNLRSTPHYGEAFKLLSRACSHQAPSFGITFLLECRNLALGHICYGVSSLGWRSEMRSIIAKLDHVLSQDIVELKSKGVGHYSLFSCHRWDRNLPLATLFDANGPGLPRTSDSDSDSD